MSNSMWHFLSRGLVLASLLATTSAAAAELQLSPVLECEQGAEARARLRSALPRIDEVEPGAKVTLTRERSGAAKLVLRSRSGAVLRVRQIPAGGESCADQLEAAALLLTTWSRELAVKPRTPDPKPVPKPEARAPRETPPVPPLAEAPPAVEPPPLVEAPPPQVAEESAVEETPEPVLEDPEREPEPEPAPPTAPAPVEPEPTSTWTIAAAAGPDWRIGLTGAETSGFLRADRALTRRLSLGLALGGETERLGERSPGQVRAQLLHAALFARWHLQQGPRTPGLSLLAGPRLERISARAEGYEENETAAVYVPALLVGVEGQQPLGAGFALFAAVHATGRVRDEVLTVRNVGGVLTLPAWGVWAGLGVSWTSR